MSRTYQPVENPSEILPYVLVGLFHLERSRVTVAGKEAPVPDGPHVAPLERLREPKLLEMLEKLLEYATALQCIAERFAGIAAWRERGEICQGTLYVKVWETELEARLPGKMEYPISVGLSRPAVAAIVLYASRFAARFSLKASSPMATLIIS